MMRRPARCAVACLALAAGGCHRAPPPDAFFPLAPGHRWTYRVSTRADNGDTVRETFKLVSLDPGTMPVEGAGEPGHRRGDDGVEYWLRADASGVYRVASQSLIERQPQPDPKPRYVLKMPYAVGTSWQVPTTAYMLVRKFDFPREVRHTYPPVPMTYRIEAAGETVETAAGRFGDCLRVRGSATMRVYADPVRGWLEAPLTTTEWYCAGVGLARLERAEPPQSSFMSGGTQLWELLAYR